jgi:RNA polymerase sigma-70 factor, ECF subfamily
MKAQQNSDIDELVRRYYPDVVRLSLAILGGDEFSCTEAEDAAQETFIAAARALDDFREQSSVKTWLFSIAINICRTRLRRRKVLQLLHNTLGGLLVMNNPGDSPQLALEKAERDAGLWAEVNALDEKHRLVILLRYVHELPAPEIAQALGISEGTVHSRLYHARHILAGRLKRFAGEEVYAP